MQLKNQFYYKLEPKVHWTQLKNHAKIEPEIYWTQLKNHVYYKVYDLGPRFSGRAWKIRFVVQYLN